MARVRRKRGTSADLVEGLDDDQTSLADQVHAFDHSYSCVNDGCSLGRLDQLRDSGQQVPSWSRGSSVMIFSAHPGPPAHHSHIADRTNHVTQDRFEFDEGGRSS